VKWSIKNQSHGIKWIKQLENTKEGCHGSFVSSTGLDTNNNAPDAFFVIHSKLYRIDYKWSVECLGSVDTGSYPTFAETGGERPLLLIADGSNLFYYNLKEGGSLHYINLPDRINEQGIKIKPTHVQVVSGSIIVNDLR